MASHHLEPSVKACHQGYLEATLRPLPAVASGDAVIIDTVRRAANAIPGSEWFRIQCTIQAVRDPGIRPDDRQEARQSLRGLGA